MDCLMRIRCDEFDNVSWQITFVLQLASLRAGYTFWPHVFLNVLIPGFSDHHRNLNLLHELTHNFKVSSPPSNYAMIESTRHNRNEQLHCHTLPHAHNTQS
jgi:hypothetical protein